MNVNINTQPFWTNKSLHLTFLVFKANLIPQRISWSSGWPIIWLGEYFCVIFSIGLAYPTATSSPHMEGTTSHGTEMAFKGCSSQSENTLPETNSKFAPENECLEDDPFLSGWPVFRGHVSLRECRYFWWFRKFGLTRGGAQKKTWNSGMDYQSCACWMSETSKLPRKTELHYQVNKAESGIISPACFLVWRVFSGFSCALKIWTKIVKFPY